MSAQVRGDHPPERHPRRSLACGRRCVGPGSSWRRQWWRRPGGSPRCRTSRSSPSMASCFASRAMSRLGPTCRSRSGPTSGASCATGPSSGSCSTSGRRPEVVARRVVGDSGSALGAGSSGAGRSQFIGRLRHLLRGAGGRGVAGDNGLAGGLRLSVKAVLATVRRNLGGYVLNPLVATGAFLLIVVLEAIVLWPVWMGTGRSLSRDAMPTYLAISIGVLLIVFAPYLHFVTLAGAGALGRPMRCQHPQAPPSCT